MAELRWIDAQPALDEVAAQVATSRWVAVDTEFLNERSYVPRLCLVQIATAELVACVDPLAKGLELGPLWEALGAPGVTKVLHAAENDLGVLLRAAGRMPAPVFDTQVAAALLGYGASIGYGALVAELCGVALDKAHARADWSRRPLPRDVVRYAADDVRHLGALHARLAAELEARGRTAWAEAEFRALDDPARYRDDPTRAWRRVRGWQRLAPLELAALAGLAEWRERTARATNRPRRWVVRDEVLVEIARRRPGSPEQLARVPGFDPRRHGADARALVAIVGHAVADADLPRPPTADEAAWVDVLRDVVRVAAEEHGLPEPMLAPLDELLAIVRGDRATRAQTGWRDAVVGARLRARLGDGPAPQGGARLPH